MLRARVLTALVLAAVILGVVLGLPSQATIALVTLVVALGAWEWSAFLRSGSTAVRVAYVAVVLVLLPLAWFATRDPATLRAMLLVTACWWLVALLWLALAPGAVTAVRAAVAGVLALVPAWVAVSRTRSSLSMEALWTTRQVQLSWSDSRPPT